VELKSKENPVKMKKLTVLLIAIMLVVSLVGCQALKGPQGERGLTGPQGPPGPSWTPTPTTHIWSIGGEGFQSYANQSYVSGGGMGGAYILQSGFGSMVAPVQIPHGAVVTRMVAFFNDESVEDLSVSLSGLNLIAGGYSVLAKVSSTGSSGYSSATDTTINNATINNEKYGYNIQAFADSWTNLRVMGVVIYYTK